MARKDQESFDKLSPAQLASTGKWTSVGSGVVSTTGRTAFGVTGTLGATQAQNTLRSYAVNPYTPQKGYTGIAVKTVTFPASEQKVWALLDTGGSPIITVTILTDGKVRVHRGNEAGTTLGTSASAFTAVAAWRYLEFGFDLADGGPLEVRCTTTGNPISLLLLIADLGLTGVPAWQYNEFYLTDQIVIDDYYANDAHPQANLGPNYFEGDTSIIAVNPQTVTYDIAYFNWTPNTGSDKAAVIDDAPPFDGDTTYLYTRQSYSWIEFAMTPITDDGRLVGDVQLVLISRAAGSSWIPNVTGSMKRWDTSRVFVQLPQNPPTTAYRAYFVPVQATGLLGGSSWTIIKVNDTRFGAFI